MVIPAVGLGLIFVYYRIRQWYIRRPDVANRDENDAEKGRSGGAVEKIDTEQRRLRDTTVWIAIGWLFLVYTILCRTTFRSFACHDIDMESFHQTDYTIVRASLFVSVHTTTVQYKHF